MADANGQRYLEFYSGFTIIPEHILHSFIEDECQMLVTADMLKEHEEGVTSGDFSSQNKLILVTSYQKEDWWHSDLRTTIVHEMGHYVDWALGEPSVGDEWNTFYEEVKNEIGESYHETPYNDHYMERTLDIMREDVIKLYGYSMSEKEIEDFSFEMAYGKCNLHNEYSFYKVEEFFANTFYLYCEYNEFLQLRYPEIHAAMERCVQKMNK